MLIFLRVLFSQKFTTLNKLCILNIREVELILFKVNKSSRILNTNVYLSDLATEIYCTQNHSCDNSLCNTKEK